MKYIFFFIITYFYILNKLIFADQVDFNTWLESFKKDAIKAGISSSTIDKNLTNVKLIPRVVELDRKQPEFTLTLRQYLRNVVNKKRINKGIGKIRENWDLLESISDQYNVQSRFIVALWGIETDYGRISGGFPVIDSLATLSYDGRRREYFSKELINALKIIDGGHIEGKNMMGSWAGAMGQPQFMPSSFLGYAQDYNNDGKKDIWTTKEDVLASAANYLSKLKWNKNQTWGREVSVTDEFNVDPAFLTLKHEKTLNDWQELGVRKLDGTSLPASTNLKASLIVIDDKNSFRYFLAYENFKKILRWNTSNFFAIAVGKLSDSITIR